MIDTNALLSIAFSLIANFTNVVPVQPEAVPQNQQDLVKLVVRPQPLSVYLIHRLGTEFWIDWGIVRGYRSPGSYFTGESLPPSNYFGTARFTSNDVVEIAARAMRRLAKRDPLAGAVLVAEPAGRWGPPIPFFRLKWLTKPDPTGAIDTIATAEVDARDGRIVGIKLYDESFMDRAFEKTVLGRVYRPDPVLQAPRTPALHYSKPTTNYVARAIGRWLLFCQRLGLDPGGETNLAEVDWETTVLFTNRDISTSAPCCVVRFTNGAAFDSAGDTIWGYVAKDAALEGDWTDHPKEYWERFRGQVAVGWTALVTNLEARLAQGLGIAHKAYEPCEASPAVVGGLPGETGLTRALVYWHRLPRLPDSDRAVEDMRSYFYAELDLEQGSVKMLVFQDAKLLSHIDRVLRP
jgi:hypothetical protein